jgi:mitosis inhibitor protein kinase SWE1
MDWAYSPHREAGGILHFPSPTHAQHSYHVDAIQKLRRSLSRSPSKSSRFQLKNSHTPNGSPSSPLSPLCIQRAGSPVYGREHHPSPAPPASLASHTPATAKGKKFTLRRVAPFRSSPRINNPSRSPVRRALSDASNQGNVTPSTSRRSSAEDVDTENALDQYINPEPEAKTPLRFELYDGPIKFEFARPKQENTAPADRHYPAKSSPLKRIDGRSNLDQSNFGSPAKRRSLHGALLGSDADVFSLFSQDTMSPARQEMSGNTGPDREMTNSPFSSTSMKRSSSLRKSTLQSQNRHAPRTRLSAESHVESSTVASPAQKARNRMSLDNSQLFGQMRSPFLRSSAKESTQPTPQQSQTPATSASKSTTVYSRLLNNLPHPLSKGITASSPGSNPIETEDDAPSRPRPNPAAPKEARKFPHDFTRSLPIGTARPFADVENDSQASFGTPLPSFRNAKPEPTAFMSTGLISKKNKRNIDDRGDFTSYEMPGTPSKRNSFPPVSGTPLNSGVKKPSRPPLEFGTPSTPFGSPGIFGGKSSNIFGVPFTSHASTRRGSFLNIDCDDNSQSPVGNPDSQSSADELPPTPTKPAGKNGKESSLRSSLFGRRTSLGPDTFVPPGANEGPAESETHHSKSFSTILNRDKEKQVLNSFPTVAPNTVSRSRIETPSASPSPFLVHSKSSYQAKQPPRSRKVMRSVSLNTVDNCSTAPPIDVPDASGRVSPHTPHESFTPPDPSGLSISAGKRDFGFSFNSSTNSNPSFPPATPTAPRDHHQFPFGKAVPVVAVTANDVEVSLTSRFEKVSRMGSGEFSEVYRVDKFTHGTPGGLSPAVHKMGGVYAVKKSKKPFTGPRDRQKQLREAQILKALRTSDHIVHFVDYWEEKNHLYIQTEFCENGNLFDFLGRTGDKARLDDFRIWKILLELTLVSKCFSCIIE